MKRNVVNAQEVNRLRYLFGGSVDINDNDQK